MFKSIEYRLITCLLILMASLMAAVLLFTRGDIAYGVVCAAIVVFSLFGLFRNYRKFNKNILFLLNAMENGDYSFHFSTNRMSLREKELNRMLNRIKEILIKARCEIIEDEEFLGTIVESVSTGIIITDEDGFVRNVNRSAMELLGLGSLSHLNQLRNVDESFPALFLTMKPGEAPLVKIANEREETELSLHLTKIVISGTPLRIITLNNIGSELEAKEIEVRIIREGNPLPLYADESQILQVLVNLVKNAAEAFDSGSAERYSGKRIELTVLASSRQTVIEVRNNGAPIPQEVLPHIFVPFFTTKESGSGIGLSLSRYIMRLHGGNLKHYVIRDWTVFGMVFCKVSPSQV